MNKLEKLPQRWFIRWESREHYGVIQGYFNSIGSYNQWTYYVPQHCDSKVNQDNKYRSWSDPDFEDSIELSFEDFERLVLKKGVPEFWQINRTPDNAEVINKWMNDFHKTRNLVTYNGSTGWVNNKNLNKYINVNVPEITFQQFKKYVLMKQPFVLPEKWYCIYKNQQEFSIANNFFKGNWTYINADGEHGFTNVDRSNHWCWKDNSLGYTQITFEQFTNYVLKPKKMEKKIIGYELKEDCKQFIPALVKISDCYTGQFFAKNSIFYDHYLEAKVLDLWFTPVYEKKYQFKIGDVVVVVSNDEDTLCNDKDFYSIGKIGKITNIVCNWGVIDNHNDAITTNQLRLATAEEIKQISFKPGDWITMLSEYCNEVLKDKTFKLVNFQGGSCWVVDHCGKDSYLAPFTSQFRLATEEEIKKAEDDLLLAEAAKRYPIGTKFYPAHANINSRYCIITSEIFIMNDKDIIATLDGTRCWDSSGDKKYGNTNLNRMVYTNGKWAEICEDVPDITINGYKAIITPFDVTFGCQKYTRAFIMKLWQCLETNDFKMDYKDDIQKLAEYYGRTEN